MMPLRLAQVCDFVSVAEALVVLKRMLMIVMMTMMMIVITFIYIYYM